MRIAPSTIRQAVAQRGRRINNIWYVCSYKMRRLFILPSDVALFHWALLEVDPLVIRFELEEPSLVTQIDGSHVGTRFDARVWGADGCETWVEVKAELEAAASENSTQLEAQRQLAQEHGVQYRLVTLQDLLPRMTRIWNALRMLQVIQAARGLELASARTTVIGKLISSQLTLAEVKSAHRGDHGLNLAAAFTLVIDRAATLDIDAKPISDESVLSRQEDDHA